MRRETLVNNSLAEVSKHVDSGLKKWAGKKELTVWKSDALTLHLNIPIRNFPIGCKWIYQVLCLGQDLIPFVLTLYDGASKDERKARIVSRKTANMLTSLLMNFCHTEFLLLPCVLPYRGTFDKDFFASELRTELMAQLHHSRDVYGGPDKLTGNALQSLTKAVTDVIRSSSVPCFLQLLPDGCEVQKPTAVYITCMPMPSDCFRLSPSLCVWMWVYAITEVCNFSPKYITTRCLPFCQKRH